MKNLINFQRRAQTMNEIVPENKTIYIGKRKFVEGEVLPPHVILRKPNRKRKKANGKFKGKSGK